MINKFSIFEVATEEEYLHFQVSKQCWYVHPVRIDL